MQVFRRPVVHDVLAEDVRIGLAHEALFVRVVDVFLGDVGASVLGGHVRLRAREIDLNARGARWRCPRRRHALPFHVTWGLAPTVLPARAAGGVCPWFVHGGGGSRRRRHRVFVPEAMCPPPHIGERQLHFDDDLDQGVEGEDTQAKPWRHEVTPARPINSCKKSLLFSPSKPSNNNITSFACHCSCSYWLPYIY